jgi:hypothetical protein
MTREQALDAIKVYAAWQYDTDINAWSVTSRDQYVDRYMQSVEQLCDTYVIGIGEVAMNAMLNPVGDLVKQLRTLQAL